MRGGGRWVGLGVVEDMGKCMIDVKIRYSVRGQRGDLYLKEEWAILDEFCTLPRHSWKWGKNNSKIVWKALLELDFISRWKCLICTYAFHRVQNSCGIAHYSKWIPPSPPLPLPNLLQMHTGIEDGSESQNSYPYGRHSWILLDFHFQLEMSHLDMHAFHVGAWFNWNSPMEWDSTTL